MPAKMFSLLLLLLFVNFNAFSNPVVDDPDSEVFTIVEVMPEFPGGETALINFIATETIYPQEARDKDIEGRVFVKFIVDREGNVTDVTVVRGAHELLDNEAVRMINSMPKWKPGTQRGVPVRVQFTVPIHFRLSDDDE